MVVDYIGKKSLETAKLQREREQAQAQLDQVKLKFDRRELKSPVEGVVLARPIQNEQFQSAGTTLLEIGDLAEMEIEADILSQDVVRVKEKDPVEISGPAIGARPVKGSVRRVFPGGFTKVSSLGVEQQRVRVIIGFAKGVLDELRRERGLGVGYRVNVRINTQEKPSALVIPRSALFRSPDGKAWRVFAVSRGRAELRDVAVGLMNDEKVEITDGLTANDKVILAPEASLHAGDRVSADK
jgi:HlyD family secretion protein